MVDIDRHHIWHPYETVTHSVGNHLVQRTQGSFIYLDNNVQLVDGMSSWWCAIHGYNHPHIVKAMQQQLVTMPHIMFGGLTHQPAVDLTALLLKKLPSSMSKVFFCDSGSVAVEVAIKMGLQYHIPSKKQKIMSLRGAYHGDTMAAMSVCDPKNSMHHLFSSLLPQQIFLPKPPENLKNYDNYKQQIQLRFEQHADECAALIIEPLLQGAGGMHMYPKAYVALYRELCNQHDVLLIFDEIATGFGRLGDWFASDLSGVTPDIFCLGKALTGGHISMACTVTTDKVAQGIESDHRVLMHGPTFMANPLACSAAKASIELLSTQNWKQRIVAINQKLHHDLQACLDMPAVKEVRIQGAVAVVELHQCVNSKNAQDFFVKRGVWIRPFGRLVYIMPAFNISLESLNFLSKVMIEFVQSV